MADRGRGGRGRGRGGFQQQSFPSRGGGIAGRGNYGGDRGRGGDRGGARGGGRGRVVMPPLFRQNGQVPEPSVAVTKLENDMFGQGLNQSLAKLNLQTLSQAPLRPAYGTKGRYITLWANYFELLPDKKQPFNHYAVSIVPVNAKDGEPKGKKLARLLQLLIKELPQHIPLASDYSSSIWTSTTLGWTQREFLITYFPETETAPSSNDPHKYKAKVQHTDTITFETLLNYLCSPDLYAETPATNEGIIQAVNTIIGHTMRTDPDIIAKKRSYFPIDGSLVGTSMLANGLQAFRGFFLSVRAATGRILLNVQIKHVAAWEAIPLPVLFDRLRAEGKSINRVSSMISGLWVIVNHLNGRMKRIAGFASPADGRGTERGPRVPQFGADAKTVQFYWDNPGHSRYVTVADYFKEVYGSPLTLPNLPVVNVGTKSNPVYMPSENCTIKKAQDYQKKLEPEATAEMIRHAVKPAPDNARTINDAGIALLKQNSENLLNSFGVKFNTSMVTVSARVLPAVRLTYAGRPETPRDASWNMRDVKFSRGASLPPWSYLWIRTKNKGGHLRSLDEVKTCVGEFHKMLIKCGMSAPQPVPGRALVISNAESPGSEIDSVFKTITAVKLLLVILPDNTAKIYNAIKNAGDIKYGIHTVGVVADGKKFAKALRDDNSQYFANVALKFNLKLGGHNQLLLPADLSFVSQGKTMLVGLDVTHPSPGSHKQAPSVSGITASIDSNLAQWPADVAIQEGGKEIIEGLKQMFKSRLRLWQKHNQKRLPEEILIYRDGVGESMYDLVRQQELPQIKEACQEMYPATDTKANKPYITLVICGKRHNTRFYPTDEREADPRTGGPRNGTIIDRGITEGRQWDFYLQAHTALQGTPKSAHYVMVHDEIFQRRAASMKSDGRSAGQRAVDELEALTHALCYMFGRATKAVSLCPPAYYADLICERARRWLNRVFDEQASLADSGEANVSDVMVHPNLKDSMFYI